MKLERRPEYAVNWPRAVQSSVAILGALSFGALAYGYGYGVSSGRSPEVYPQGAAAEPSSNLRTNQPAGYDSVLWDDDFADALVFSSESALGWTFTRAASQGTASLESPEVFFYKNYLTATTGTTSDSLVLNTSPSKAYHREFDMQINSCIYNRTRTTEDTILRVQSPTTYAPGYVVLENGIGSQVAGDTVYYRPTCGTDVADTLKYWRGMDSYPSVSADTAQAITNSAPQSPGSSWVRVFPGDSTLLGDGPAGPGTVALADSAQSIYVAWDVYFESGFVFNTTSTKLIFFNIGKGATGYLIFQLQGNSSGEGETFYAAGDNLNVWADSAYARGDTVGAGDPSGWNPGTVIPPDGEWLHYEIQIDCLTETVKWWRNGLVQGAGSLGTYCADHYGQNKTIQLDGTWGGATFNSNDWTTKRRFTDHLYITRN